MRQKATQRSGDAGFTLVEVLAVLAIIALVFALTVPGMMQPSERLILAKTVRELKSAMRLTRSSAILKAREHVLMIDMENGRYASPATGPAYFPEGITAKAKIAETERETEMRGAIRFFPDGSSSGGEIRLTLGQNSEVVCIHWLTGRPVDSGQC